MRIISATAPGALSLAGRGVELSRLARQRLKWMDYYESHGHNVALTCRHFDISRQTFYRWRRRYNPLHLRSLEDRPRRPRRVRQPTASPELVEAVLEVREKSPGWGKDKLVVLLREAGWSVSTSMVGRILGRLRERGVLVEPPRQSVSVRRRAHPRPYAVRKPKEYVAKLPGDLVQVDTLDLRPAPGIVLKQFTGCDVVSRCNVLSVYSRATSHCASLYLDELEDRSPFPIRAIQVDGGSEFQASFEEECRRRGILLFVLPPHSPKLNGHVERAHRTHQEEFYEVADLSWSLNDLRPQLLRWEHIYNTVRPHQALGYRTPLQFLVDLQRQEAV
jgi:putative transposase